MAVFENVIDLRFAVSDLVGNRVISDVFPMLIGLAEHDLNNRLRTRHQIVDDTLTFEDGISPLPPDFLEILHVGQRPGLKRRFQIDGFNIAIPGLSGDLDISYYAKLPSLTCSPTACNWLLRQSPSIYLYGVGLQAAKHLRDADLAVKISSLYGEAIGLLIINDERARWSAATVRVAGLTP